MYRIRYIKIGIQIYDETLHCISTIAIYLNIILCDILHIRLIQ